MNNDKGQKNLILIGASGHGKVIADIAELNGYDNIAFLDDNPDVRECYGYPVIGPTSKAASYECDKIVAIGNASIRERIQKNIETVSLIHPAAVVAHDVKMGDGCVVMAGAVINPGTIIGNGVIINTASSVDHDCIIEDYTHVAVGAHICGTVHVGKRTWIGAGATVVNNVEICDDCMIGAGATVVKSIKEAGTYVGVPARLR